MTQHYCKLHTKVKKKIFLKTAWFLKIIIIYYIILFYYLIILLYIYNWPTEDGERILSFGHLAVVNHLVIKDWNGGTTFTAVQIYR